jgi:hypothetical protein
MIFKFQKQKASAYRAALAVAATLFLTTAFTNNRGTPKFMNQTGVFYADTLFWSGENHEIYFKGKVMLRYGKQNFKGNGSFSVIGKVGLLIFDGNHESLNSSILLSGKKCEIVTLNAKEATKKYGSTGNMGAVEITSLK